MAVHGNNNFFGRNAQLVGGSIDDALVGLMWHEPVDIGSRIASCLEGILDHVGDHGHRVLEDLPPLHSETANGLGRGRPTIYVELPLVPAIRTEVGGQDSAVLASACLRLCLED